MTMKNVVITAIIIAISGFCGFVFGGVLKRRNDSNTKPMGNNNVEKLDTLKFEDIANWVNSLDLPNFDEKNYAAMIARYPSEVVQPISESINKADYSKIFRICIYDKSSKTIIEDRYIVCNELNQDILELLGKDDCVILK